jgi:hypothetical protein
MSTAQRLLPVVAISGSTLLVGCGGGACCYGSYGSYGGCSYGSCGSYGGADPAGIYEGSLTDPGNQQSIPVIAIIAEDGEGRMSAQDGTYYRLSVGTTGNGLSGSFQGYSQGASFPDGTQTAGGMLSGTVQSAAIQGTLTYVAGQTQPLTLTFDNAYDNNTPSLAALAGSWSYSSGGFTLNATVGADGSFSATDSNACEYSGSFTIVDPSFDAYHVSYTRTCNGVSASFMGLSSYFPASGSGASAAPVHIELLADDGAGDFLAAELR